nr:MAG TPA_asm: hypothetical protein [Caudoviricetes sp.]
MNRQCACRPTACTEPDTVTHVGRLCPKHGGR